MTTASLLFNIVSPLYLIASILTFSTYAWDKSAARAGRWRVPEKYLHFLSLAGGWPGALLAQRLLHHKSRKQPFRIIFWGSVALNCTMLCGLVYLGGKS
jgi:uncharacterized membrane protein YsdA (DUF1294 family)